MIENEVNKFFSSKVDNLNNEVRDKINFYFCNTMTEYYNKEENNLKDIIYHVHSVNENSEVHLNVYYRNCKIKSSPSRESEANDHCVYRYTCNEGQCNLYYI